MRVAQLGESLSDISTAAHREEAGIRFSRIPAHPLRADEFSLNV